MSDPETKKKKIKLYFDHKDELEKFWGLSSKYRDIWRDYIRSRGDGKPSWLQDFNKVLSDSNIRIDDKWSFESKNIGGKIYNHITNENWGKGNEKFHFSIPVHRLLRKDIQYILEDKNIEFWLSTEDKFKKGFEEYESNLEQISGELNGGVKYYPEDPLDYKRMIKIIFPYSNQGNDPFERFLHTIKHIVTGYLNNDKFIGLLNKIYKESKK